MTTTEKITAAAAYIRNRIKTEPTIGLVLGSGLGDYADTLEDTVRISYSEIPNFPVPSIAGHSGALVFGRKCGKEVVIMQGRIHYYEGLPQQEITLSIRVLAALGIKTLVLTNACGGVNLAFAPGDLMLISDHINFSGNSPLIGPNLEAFGPRFPDMSDLYTASLRKIIKEQAEQADLFLQEGVYAMYSGPNYETPAEIRMFRTLGADTVGMSTVPEAIAAAHCGMETAGIACIANYAAGISEKPLSVEDITETAKKAVPRMKALLKESIIEFSSLR